MEPSIKIIYASGMDDLPYSFPATKHRDPNPFDKHTGWLCRDIPREMFHSKNWGSGRSRRGTLQCLLHPLKPLDPDIFSCWCIEMLLISKVKRPQKTTRNDMNETLGYMKQLRKPHIWFMIILQHDPKCCSLTSGKTLYIIYTYIWC